MNLSVDTKNPIVLYDGVCNLCTRSVRFVIERDAKKQFRFASLQSQIADKLLGAELKGEEKLESMVLIVDDKIYRKSTAALLTAKRLNGLWPLIAIFLIVPKPIRDMVYDWIGRHRHQILGKQEACWRPTQDLTDRFLDA